MEMAAQINNRGKGFEYEIKKVNDKMSLLSDEKVMLENQMVEIKKAYDREVERRITAEDKLKLFETSDNNSSQKDISKNMPDESKSIAENIQLLKTELESEKAIRLSIENELNKLLIRLREHYS